MGDNPGESGISRKPPVRLECLADFFKIYLYSQKGMRESLNVGSSFVAFLFSSRRCYLIC